MPLSDDQRAMLRLLAQREQGYEDIAALMGISVDAVRAKVNEALAQLEDEGIEPPPIPPELPIAPQPPEPPQPSPPPPAKQPEPAAPAPPEPPAAPLPAPPKTVAEEKPPAASPPPRRPASGPPRLTLPAGKRARVALAAAAVAVIAVVVVLIVGGGGSDTTTTSSTASGEGSTEAETTPTSNSAAVTKAVLKAVGGGSGSGVAIFGRVKNSLALQVEAEGLEPISKNQSYTIWLAQSPRRMLPLASTPLDKKGRIAAQFEVPTEVLAYLANGTFDQLVITRTANAALKAALAKATKEERAPAYTGTEVMRGTVTGPIVGAQLRKETEEKEEGK
jgi:hypothetical protein